MPQRRMDTQTLQRSETASPGRARRMRVRIAILLFHAFLVQLAINVAKPTLAYRALEANIPVEYIGLLAGSFSILPVLLALPIGRIADSRPTRGLVVAGALAMVVAGVGLLIASDSLFVLIIWSVLIGLGHLIGVLAGQLLIGRLAPKDLDSWFGYYTLTAAAGQGCGPSGGWPTLDHSPPPTRRTPTSWPSTTSPTGAD